MTRHVYSGYNATAGTSGRASYTTGATIEEAARATWLHRLIMVNNDSECLIMVSKWIMMILVRMVGLYDGGTNVIGCLSIHG